MAFERAEQLCETLTEAQDALTREMIAHLADKWSLWTMTVLARISPIRFSRILEHVEGVSQKSLTKTLRQLEKDGLATRKVYAEVPPRVEYSITPLGLEMLDQVEPLWLWVASKIDQFESARANQSANIS